VRQDEPMEEVGLSLSIEVTAHPAVDNLQSIRDRGGLAGKDVWISLRLKASGNAEDAKDKIQ
jgi:hypothetical protein